MDGQTKSFPKGITGLAIAQQFGATLDLLAVQVNGLVYDLTRPIEVDATLHFLRWEDEAGKQLFWHSSAHLLAAALSICYPGVTFGIGPPIAEGFYYDVDLGPYPTNSLDLAAIEREMMRLAQRKDPFVRRVVSKQEAIAFFTKKKILIN